MLKSILIGLDGSPSGEVAVELGIRWAKEFNALIVGLGIVDEVAILTPDAEYAGLGDYESRRTEGLLDEARRSVKQRLEQLAERCTESDVSFNLLQDSGLPYEEILRESQRCDLVLFGHETHFRFGLADRPNETLWKVLKREPRPVVVAPSRLEDGASVVVAYNGSPQSDRALQAFQSSGLDLGEEVWVLSADDGHDEVAGQAERAVEFLRLHRINAMPHPIEPADSVSRSIVDEVRQRNSRLLVMGACGHSRIREFLLGSTTRAVLEESPVPVFMCH
jgi:nucleotide-binding universal stress UspA family protein